MEELSQQIFNKLNTKKRANDFLIFTDLIKSFSHRVGELNIDDLIVKNFSEIPDWYKYVKSLIPDLSAGKVTKDVVVLIENVSEKIKNANVLKIEMSFEPSDSFVDEVISVFRTYESQQVQSDKDFIVDVDVREDLEPGAQIFTNGRLMDLSLRSQVVDYLMSKDVINRYL